MESEPLVFAILQVWNRERWLGWPIASVLSGSNPRVELIVIDNGSTDVASRVARSFGRSLTFSRSHADTPPATLGFDTPPES
jgi:glycosyltransferase involved in cell wall biosynthesis